MHVVRLSGNSRLQPKINIRIYGLEIESGTSTQFNLKSHLSGVRVIIFSATFNNISVISWRSVLLMEETGENHRPVANH